MLPPSSGYLPVSTPPQAARTKATTPPRARRGRGGGGAARSDLQRLRLSVDATTGSAHQIQHAIIRRRGTRVRSCVGGCSLRAGGCEWNGHT
jgi:hypothetical protein